MSSAKELLYRAGDAMEEYAVSEQTIRIAKLMALHLVRRVGSGASDEEAKLLLELLGQE
jgi:DeoR/GlpR family transcriptional regulator of sugar metabolism